MNFIEFVQAWAAVGAATATTMATATTTAASTAVGAVVGKCILLSFLGDLSNLGGSLWLGEFASSVASRVLFSFSWGFKLFILVIPGAI